MNKYMISDVQAISTIVLFLGGTSSILSFGVMGGKDIWLSVILAFTMSLILVGWIIYIQKKFKSKDLFDIFKICLGKYVGTGMILLYTWFLFHECALVTRNVYQFISQTALDETPNMVISVCFLFLCVWAVKCGIEVIGRWSAWMIILFIGCLSIMFLVMVPQMNIKNIYPILDGGFKSCFKASIAIFSFPFGEIIVFTTVFYRFKDSKSLYKIYLGGLCIGGIIVFISYVSILLVLGSHVMQDSYYPVYTAVERIQIADFLENIEPIVAMVLIIGGFIKVSIYLLGACRGITKVFGYIHSNFIVIPVALNLINLIYISHGNSIVDYKEWNFEIFPYYAFLFEAILPIIVLGVVTIRKPWIKD